MADDKLQIRDCSDIATNLATVRALGLERSVPQLGSLAEGAPGDVVVLDPQAEWTVEPERFASKGKSTPLAGRTLRGRVVATVVGGSVAWAEEKARLQARIEKHGNR